MFETVVPVNYSDPEGLFALQAENGKAPRKLTPCEQNPNAPECVPGGPPPRVTKAPKQLPVRPAGGYGASTLSDTCVGALATAGMRADAVDRALAEADALKSAVNGTDIDWRMLAAIGVRETGFRNITEKDGAGVGVGIFQITVSASSGVTKDQAQDLAWAAKYAADMLSKNMGTLHDSYPALDAAHLLQATAASYNFGTGNISGNPDTIDVGSAHNNYGSNVVNLMDCFK